MNSTMPPRIERLNQPALNLRGYPLHSVEGCAVEPDAPKYHAAWRLRYLRRAARSLPVAALAAAGIWIAWIFIADYMRVREELVVAQEAAAAVYIPYRNRWLCRPIERRAGAWVCIEPKGKL